MSRISDAFKSGKAFIPFITGGDPDLNTTLKLVLAMQEAGADVIEIGIPFSDPIAEGVVIQEADLRALNAGTTTDKLIDAIKTIKEQVTVPLIFMTYANVIFKYGASRFMDRCNECGISGIIVPDGPYEERDEISPYCRAAGIDYIPLVAPTSHERISKISKSANGYVYVVSSLGVTGMRDKITSNIQEMTDLVRQATDVPCAVGFGIKDAESAKAMSQYADGVIVGSAIVDIIAKNGQGSIEPVKEFVSTIKKAIME